MSKIPVLRRRRSRSRSSSSTRKSPKAQSSSLEVASCYVEEIDSDQVLHEVLNSTIQLRGSTPGNSSGDLENVSSKNPLPQNSELDINNNPILPGSDLPIFKVLEQNLPRNYELDINNNPIRTGTTISILPSYKILQIPNSSSGDDTLIKSSKDFPTKTYPRKEILQKNLTYSTVTRTTIPATLPEVDMDSKNISAADFHPDASEESKTIMLQINKSLQLLRESSGGSKTEEEESLFSSITSYFTNFDCNLESDLLNGVLGCLGSSGGGFLKGIVGSVDSSEFVPTDSLTYNGYKFTISGRGIMMKSLKFNEQYYQKSAAFGDNYRIGLEIGLKKRGPPPSHPPKKTLTDNCFTLAINFPDEFDDASENLIKVYVPAGVSTKLIKWKVFGNVLVVACP